LQSLKRADKALAWRGDCNARDFRGAFARGYLVTDFVFESATRRGFYVLILTESGAEIGADGVSLRMIWRVERE